MKTRVTLASLAAILIATTGLTALSASPAAASLPQCTTESQALSPTSGYWLHLPVTASFSTSCYLAKGDHSNAVWVLQHTLNACYGKTLVEDGDFGTNTYNALRDVQNRIGASPIDGVYGTNTRDHMKFRDNTSSGLCYRW